MARSLEIAGVKADLYKNNEEKKEVEKATDMSAPKTCTESGSK